MSLLYRLNCSDDRSLAIDDKWLRNSWAYLVRSSSRGDFNPVNIWANTTPSTTRSCVVVAAAPDVVVAAVDDIPCIYVCTLWFSILPVKIRQNFNGCQKPFVVVKVRDFFLNQFTLPNLHKHTLIY